MYLVITLAECVVEFSLFCSIGSEAAQGYQPLQVLCDLGGQLQNFGFIFQKTVFHRSNF